MKILAVINFENTPDDKSNGFDVRNAARAVILDKDERIALMYSEKGDFYKLPGGGIEEGEDVVGALRRECLEETGVEIEDLTELGMTKEIRGLFKTVQNSYYYSAKATDNKRAPSLTKEEIEAGFKLLWVTVEDAIKLIRKKEDSCNELGRYVIERETIVLESFKSNKN
jgi:8-oxo-dGTP pyrophosphatase MutT (NUDIX family)